MNPNLLFSAWKRLLGAYMVSLVCSLVLGSFSIHLLGVSADTVFEMSTKRLSYAIPVFDAGTQAGIDPGVLIFVWNLLGALATISFLYTAGLLNPADLQKPPRTLRKLLCGKKRMRLLCFLPGCARIGPESLRRLYVWLMIPMLSLVLLGVESGLSIATAQQVFGSYWTGLISIVPHGIVEIPAFSLAGAVTYSAHLMVKDCACTDTPQDVFHRLHAYKARFPLWKIVLLVFLSLLAAGFIEAHITRFLLEPAVAMDRHSFEVMCACSSGTGFSILDEFVQLRGLIRV